MGHECRWGLTAARRGTGSPANATPARPCRSWATGRLVPTNVDYRQSISTIQVSKIPKWEWPVLGIEIPVTGVDVTVKRDAGHTGR